MNGNHRNLDHYNHVLSLLRSYAAQHARRHMVLLDSHVPSGGLVREEKLLMDFHSSALRIMEVPDRPQEAILKVAWLASAQATEGKEANQDQAQREGAGTDV